MSFFGSESRYALKLPASFAEWPNVMKVQDPRHHVGLSKARLQLSAESELTSKASSGCDWDDDRNGAAKQTAAQAGTQGCGQSFGEAVQNVRSGSTKPRRRTATAHPHGFWAVVNRSGDPHPWCPIRRNSMTH